MLTHEFIALLKSKNIIKTGHFKLTSGRHSDTFINKDAMYSDPEIFNYIVNRMAYDVCDIRNINTVTTGPAIAGAVLAAVVACASRTIFVYPEKADVEWDGQILKQMIFRRGYDKVLKGKEVILIEDIITTGGSLELTMESIEKCGGKVVGVFAIWNRGTWKPKDSNIVFKTIVTQSVESYIPEECPNCLNNIPIQDPKA